MHYLLTAEEMKRCDSNTSAHFGLPVEVLMERAALAVADQVEKHLSGMPEEKGRGRVFVLVMAGGGNNGADAVAAGRILMLCGVHVTFVTASEPDHFSPLMKLQTGIVAGYGKKIHSFPSFLEQVQKKKTADFQVIIDGLFGIGLNRVIDGPYSRAVNAINEWRNKTPAGYVCAVDLPSGIHTDNGAVMGTAVRADETVTFNFRKLGHVLYPGCEFTGKLVVKDVGITGESFLGEQPGAFSFDEDMEALLPKRVESGNKSTFGKVLIIAGSPTMSGACILAAKGCLRMGAGMVRVFTAKENRTALQTCLPEALLDIYDGDAFDSDSCKAADLLRKALTWSDTLVIGPGLGREKPAAIMLEMVLKSYSKPAVIDADALNLIAESKVLKDLVRAYGRKNEAFLILTPHLGEFARLTGQSVEDCRKQLLTLPKRLADDLQAAVICKDARSVVADCQERRVYVNESGNSGMASAGSGDVLAGMAGALCALPLSAFQTACRACYLHGLAGDRAAERLGKHYMTASDIIRGLRDKA